jgi:hypothetical protein
MLLVKVRPSLLRLIAPEARVWIEKNWERWTKDKPDFFTDRWKRGLPGSILPQQVRKQLGGENRRRSTRELIACPESGLLGCSHASAHVVMSESGRLWLREASVHKR